jgi:hypothetical protein
VECSWHAPPIRVCDIVGIDTFFYSPVLDDAGHSEACMGPLDAVVHPRLFHYLPSTLLEELTTLLLLLLFNPGVRPGCSISV